MCRVLGRLQEAGLRLKLAKCEFMKERVEYLGHIITRNGLHPSPKNVEAVLLAPRPQDVKSLQSYLGLINFYRKFIPRLSAVLHPLNRLLVPDVPWTWTSSQEEAFSQSKSLLASAETLAHFDPKKRTVLVTDASPYGLGAVLAQREASGEERPIAFASRSLVAAERNYSQLDKEALAMVFGVTRFKQYLWGRSFEAATDHKPLLGLLAADKPIPESCSPRILRWALYLSGYDYTLKYVQAWRTDSSRRRTESAALTYNRVSGRVPPRGVHAPRMLPKSIVSPNGCSSYEQRSVLVTTASSTVDWSKAALWTSVEAIRSTVSRDERSE